MEGVNKPEVSGWIWFIVIIIVVMGIYVLMGDSKKETQTQNQRPISGTYVIPPGKTIAKTIEGNTLKYYFQSHDCKDKIYIRVKSGDWYRKLVWHNDPLKNIKIDKRAETITAVPPQGKSLIKFTNLNNNTNIIVKVKIYPCDF